MHLMKKIELITNRMYAIIFITTLWKKLNWSLTGDIKKTFQKNVMALFYGWGSTTLRWEPLRGASLLFTTKFQGINGTHFINLGRMKGWVDFGATQWFWRRDPEIGNPETYRSMNALYYSLICSNMHWYTLIYINILLKIFNWSLTGWMQ